MYMKPIFQGEKLEERKAICEFCGKIIATVGKRADGGFYWKKEVFSNK